MGYSKKIIKSLFLSLFIAFSGNVSGAAVDSVTVAGRIVNLPAKGARTVIVNECDISDKSERKVAEVDSAGAFMARIPFSFGHTFTINYKKRLFINVYAEPGDSVFVEIDASKKPLEFHVSGDNGTMNEEYSHAYNDLSPIYHGINLPADTVPFAEYMPAFKKEVARTGSIVRNYVEKNKISQDVAMLLCLDNLFNIANQAIGFRGRGLEEQLAFLTDPIFGIENAENAKVMIFPYHLSSLCARFPEYVKNMPRGLAKDLAYASSNGEIVPERSEFADTAYYDRIYGDSDVNLEVGSIKSGDVVVLEGDSIYTLKRQNPLEWVMKKYPGRPIYLDFSATWCGPCRVALASSEGVREHFKDSEIVFVVCWLKSDKESWTMVAPSIHNAVQIFVDDDDLANRMMSTLNVNGFPAYYLIGRDGGINHDGVPGFKDPELPEFLRSLK